MAMANVKMTCSECGKEYTVSVKHGSRKAADEFEAYIKSQAGQCPACYRKHQNEKRDSFRFKEAAEIREFDRKNGFPALEGSEKQEAWAVAIRHEAIVSINIFAMGKLYKGAEITAENAQDSAIGIKAFLCGEKSAKFFIDHRDESVQGWLDLISARMS